MGDHRRRLQQQQQQGMNGGAELDLPPGFRFHPTDEEIITFYLAPKMVDRSYCAIAVGEVDLNKSEPWELPGKAKMGEKEWYFYCQKDRKYPTGMRTNRATEAGYWKATGKDKEIYRPPLVLIGMKKTLVFYKGRAPRGDKTNWVMHEYRLEGRLPYPTDSTTTAINTSPKDEWVVCRIFHKSSGIKKAVPSYAVAMNDQRSISMPMPMGEQSFTLNSTACTLPPLMDPSSLYATAASSSVVAAPPPVSSYLHAGPSLGLGNAALPMNSHYFGFGNHQMTAAAQPMLYQQQMQMGLGAEGFEFMAGPGSGPSSMVSQEDTAGLSNNAAAEISSVDLGMDGIWKWKY